MFIVTEYAALILLLCIFEPSVSVLLLMQWCYSIITLHFGELFKIELCFYYN